MEKKYYKILLNAKYNPMRKMATYSITIITLYLVIFLFNLC